MTKEKFSYYHVSKTVMVLRDKPFNSVYLGSNEEDSLDQEFIFHVLNGDYFSNLATILGFFEETLEKGSIDPKMREFQLKSLKAARENLLYLEKNYQLVPKK